jgi:hypothetical protein
MVIVYDQIHTNYIQSQQKIASTVVSTLAREVDDAYFLGPGTIKNIRLVMPKEVDLTNSYISDKSIVLRVLGSDYVATTTVPVRGNWPNSDGSYVFVIKTYNDFVSISLQPIDFTPSQVSAVIPQGSYADTNIVLTNSSQVDATYNFSIDMNSIDPSIVSVTKLTEGTSITITTSSPEIIPLRLSCSRTAFGSYSGSIILSPEDTTDVNLSVPINIVCLSTQQKLSIFPQTKTLTGFTGVSSSDSMSVCNSTPVEFTSSSATIDGNASFYVYTNFSGSINPNSCRTLDLNIRPPSIIGNYTGRIYVSSSSYNAFADLNLVVVPGAADFNTYWNNAYFNSDNNLIGGIRLVNNSQSMTVTGFKVLFVNDLDDAHLTGFYFDSNTNLVSTPVHSNEWVNATFSVAPGNHDLNLGFSGNIHNNSEKFRVVFSFTNGPDYWSEIFDDSNRVRDHNTMDFNAGTKTQVTVDTNGVRLTLNGSQYYSDGNFYSRVFDLNGIVDFNSISWSSTAIGQTINNIFKDSNSSTLYPNFNLSQFIAKRIDNNTWTPSGELDWNLASRNDTNYTSWKSEYLTDYNLPSDTNLVGLWHLNSITGNDNVLAGKVGNDLNFDGVNDGVVIDGAVSKIKDYNAGTLSIWFKSTKQFAAGGSDTLFTMYGSSSANAMALYSGQPDGGYPNGDMYFLITRNNVNVLVMVVSEGNRNTYQDGNWHNVIVRTGNGASTIFIDGIDKNAQGTLYYKVGDKTTNEFSYILSPLTADFGIRNINGTYSLPYTGQLDQFRIWNTALTDTDINRVYQTELAGIQLNNTDKNSSNVVAEYLLDENSTSDWGSLTPDTSGNNKHGSEIGMLGAITPNSAKSNNDGNLIGGANIIGSGLWKTKGFTHGAQSYMLALTNSDLNLQNYGTMSGWLYLTNTVGQFFFGNEKSTGVGYGLNTYPATSTITLDVGQAGNLLRLQGGSIASYANQWVHLVGVWDKDRNFTGIYLNGVLIASSYFKVAPTTHTYFSVGQYQDSLNNSATSTNKIEEVAVWTRGLSSNEILSLYQSQKNKWMDTNLIGYWKFNLASGTTVFDSARGNNGTLTGTGANINAQGMWDTNAFNGNGSSQYVVLGANDNIPDGTQNLTVSAWINGAYSSCGGSYCPIFSRGTSTTGYTVSVNKSTSMVRIFRNGGTTYWDSGYILTPNVWTHLAMVKSSNGNLTLYVNGVDYNSTTGFSINANTGGNNYMGFFAGYSHYFLGKIDEVKVWDRNLSASEIQADYNQWLNSKFIDSNVDSVGENVTLGTVKVNKNLNYNFNKELETFGDGSLAVNELSSTSSMGASALYSDANLVGLWHFNSITGNDSVLTGKVGNDLNIDGTTQGYVQASIPNVDYNEYTLMAWGRPWKFAIGTGGANKIIGDEYYSYQMHGIKWDYVNASTATVSIQDTNGAGTTLCSSYTTTRTVTSNQWHHYTQVYSRSQGVNILYIDGVQDGNTTTICNNLAPWTYLRLNSAVSGRQAYSEYDGARLWNRALTPTEIANIYNDENAGYYRADMNRTNLQGEWLFDENATSDWGSLTPDTSGNNKHGAEINLIGAVTPDSSPKHNDINMHQGFNTLGKGHWGTNDFNTLNSGYGEKPVNQDLNLTNTGTISAWVKNTATTGINYGIAGTINSSTNGYILRIGDSGGEKIWLDIYGGGVLNRLNTCPVPIGWIHVVGTWDGNFLKTYLNGILCTTLTQTTTANNSTNKFRLTSYDSANINTTFLETDEIAIWGRALTATEINNLYLSQAGNFQNNSLIGLWHLNDKNASGWVKNSATNTYDGNLINGADVNGTGLWSTNAGWFNGMNSDINIMGTAYTSFKNATRLTASAWVYRTGTNPENLVNILTRRSLTAEYGSFMWSYAPTTGTTTVVYDKSDGSSDCTISSATFAIPLYTWTNIVTTYTGTNCYLYANGVQIASASGASAWSPSSNNYPLLIGNSYYKDNNRAFNGKIEDVAIWNTALTAQQVLDLYRKGVSRLDLNIYACSDNTCNTKTSEVAYTDINNNTNYSPSITGSYFDYSLLFRQGTGFDRNASNYFVGAFLSDVNSSYNVGSSRSSVSFSLRASDNNVNWSDWNTITGNSPQSILLDNNRFVQYWARLATTNTLLSPVLRDVNISYTRIGN